jgi:hypothetical protein
VYKNYKRCFKGKKTKKFDKNFLLGISRSF